MEILEDPKLEDDAMRELYEASLNGCVSTLNTLIQKDRLILSKVPLYHYTKTPLHIASLLGHLEFCQVLLHNRPHLASEVDSKERCPLHLASANGHTEVVKALLMTNPEMCLARDRNDMLPLHFAAMRGRVGAIKELIKAKPDSIREMAETDDGSVLHLCVRYNHLEALKFLVEALRADHEFLSLKDKDNNSAFHLAVKHRQTKIIKYLLSLSEISTEINTLSREGLTTMSMLERCPSDFISQSILTEGVENLANEIISQEPVSSTTQVSEQRTTLSTSTSRQQPTSSQSITVIIIQPYPPQTSQQSLITNDPLQTSASSLTNNDPLQTSAPSLTNNGPLQTSAPLLTNNDPLQTSVPSLTNVDPSQASTPSASNDIEPAEPSSQQTTPPPPLSNNDTTTTSQSNGPVQQVASSNIITNEQRRQSRWNKLETFCRKYLLDKGNPNEIKSREQLMVAATVIATMTFQSVISPPGGVWQGDTREDGHTCPDFGYCEAGTAVVGYAWSPDFLKFIFFNSSSFFSSLCVMLVLMSGFPLDNKVVMWSLDILMIAAASCMLLTYMWALGLVSPDHIYYKIRKLGYLLVGTWAVLLVLVGLIQTSRIVFWARSRLYSSRTSTD